MATPQFDFFPRDFLASTIGWPAAARGHYITLLCVAWEQDGLPGDPRRVEAISPGLADEWPEWEEKFPVGEDGRRRNPRLERERDYRKVRSEAGKAGAEARWGENGKNGKRYGKRMAGAIEIASASHMRHGMDNGCGPGGDCAQAESGADLAPEVSDFAPPENTGENGKNGKRMAGAIEFASSSHMANGMAKRCPPSPSPALLVQNTTRAYGGSFGGFGEPGWAAEEWERFVAVWNRTGRAVPWTPLVAPSAWVEHAASPGWLERAGQAMAKLPGCVWFEKPLAVTRFFGLVDRILAGEFDQGKQPTGGSRQPIGGNL